MTDDDADANRCNLIADEAFAAAGFDWDAGSNWATDEAFAVSRTEPELGAAPTAAWSPRREPRPAARAVEREAPGAYAQALAEGRSPGAGREILAEEDRRVERILLELRLREGCPLDLLQPDGLAASRRALTDGGCWSRTLTRRAAALARAAPRRRRRPRPGRSRRPRTLALTACSSFAVSAAATLAVSPQTNVRSALGPGWSTSTMFRPRTSSETQDRAAQRDRPRRHVVEVDCVQRRRRLRSAPPLVAGAPLRRTGRPWRRRRSWSARSRNRSSSYAGRPETSAVTSPSGCSRRSAAGTRPRSKPIFFPGPAGERRSGKASRWPRWTWQSLELSPSSYRPC
ncbi:hypothetical protein SBADM41S_01568 [Streptomyces badius]